MTSSSSSVILEEQQQHKRIEDLFHDGPDFRWISLLVHTFEQNPCNVLIISQMILGGNNLSYYYCKLHPEIFYYSIHLDTIEHHHYKYNKEPEWYNSKILVILNGGPSSKRWPLRQSVLDRVAGYKSQHSGVSITRRFYVVVVIEQICLLFIWLRQTEYKRR